MQNLLPIATRVPDTPAGGHKAACMVEFKFFYGDNIGQPKLGDAAKRNKNCDRGSKA